MFQTVRSSLRKLRHALEPDDQEPERRLSLFADVLLPGGLVGTVAAFIMVAVSIALSLALGQDPARPGWLVAGVFFRTSPHETEGAALLGLAIHFAFSVGLATTFALLLPRGGPSFVALLLGWAFGFILQALVPVLVLPWACPAVARDIPAGELWLMHSVFGASLGLLPGARAFFTWFDRLWRRLHRLERAIAPTTDVLSGGG